MTCLFWFTVHVFSSLFHASKSASCIFFHVNLIHLHVSSFMCRSLCPGEDFPVTMQNFIGGFFENTFFNIEQPRQWSPTKISRKRHGRRRWRRYIRQESFVKMTFFKVDLKCFPMEQSLSQIYNCILGH